MLAELVGRRRQIIDMMVAERQREKRAANVRVRKSLARHIAMLEKELGAIDQDIDTLVRGSPVWRAKEDLLASVPSIGKTLARTLLADARPDNPVGRKFDFLCQEFNREANTLCSKSADIELTRIGIDLKGAIERLREQVQNVE